MDLLANHTELFMLAVALLAAGVVTGILAGLFGVGGGAVMVPVLYELFRLTGISEPILMPLCVGTSLAVIIPTSIRSWRGHSAKGAVDQDILKVWAIPILLGVIAGALIARHADPWVFKVVFIAVAGVNAVKMLFGKDSWKLSETLPGRAVMRAYGGCIGILSALMGIGGGALSNLLLTLHGRSIHQAVGTSSGVGVLISIPATIGYVYAGWPAMPDLPPFSAGYVSLPGFLLLIPTTVLCAPLGVKIAHALPRRTLEVAFGIFLAVVALRFVFSLVISG
ncbi:MAG: sulfite exporter TauE/SafE family protein [Rhodospirillaceae bacterium]